MKIKRVIYVLLLVVYFAVVPSLGWSEEGGQKMAEEYFNLSQQVWESEEVLVSKLSLKLTDVPDNFSIYGMTEKYFLMDDFSETWMFKIHPLKLLCYFPRQVSKTLRFCGFNTPLLVDKTISFNHKFYLGTLQEIVEKEADIREIKDLEKITSEQIRDILVQEVVSFLLGVEQEYLLGKDYKLYAIDLNFIHFFSEKDSPADEALLELFQYRKDDFKEEHLKKIRYAFCKNRRIINFSYDALTRWEDFYKGDLSVTWQGRNTYFAYLLRQKNDPTILAANIEESAKLINFLLMFSDEQFLKLLTVEQLKGNSIYENYIASILQRKKDLKRHFKQLYQFLNKGHELNLNMDKCYSTKEMQQKIEQLTLYKEKLWGKIEQLGRIKKEEEVPKNWNVYSSAEAWMILTAFQMVALTYTEAKEALTILKEKSGSVSEEEAITYYIEQLHRYIGPRFRTGQLRAGGYLEPKRNRLFTLKSLLSKTFDKKE